MRTILIATSARSMSFQNCPHFRSGKAAARNAHRLGHVRGPSAGPAGGAALGGHGTCPRPVRVATPSAAPGGLFSSPVTAFLGTMTPSDLADAAVVLSLARHFLG